MPGPWDFGAYNGRLYKQDDRIKKRIGGWCAKDKRKGQWLQVDLGKIKFVTAVATQGMIDTALTGFHAGPLSCLNWNLEILGFLEGEKPGNPEKNPRSKARTNNKLDPHMESGRIRTQATWLARIK